MKKNLIISLEKIFPFLVLSAATLAFYKPELFLWVKPYITVLLGAIMMCIGLTIDTVTLKTNLSSAHKLSLVVIVKFVFLSFLGFFIGKIFNLPLEIIIGLVIVGVCPGGVSANVMSYLSKSNVALAVILTIVTTLLCPIVMPAIIYLLLHETITVPFEEISYKLFWIVAFPLVDGLIIRRFFLKQVEKITWVFPPISISLIVLIIGFVAASNREVLLDNSWIIAVIVLFMNLSGYLAGYFFAGLLGYAKPSRKTIAFEYGIQDSSIGIMLATTFFSPLAALPSALFSIIQNLTGPLLVNFFKKPKVD